MAEFRMVLGASADVVSGDEMRDSLSSLQGHIDKRFAGMGVRTPMRRKLAAAGTVTDTLGTLSVIKLVFGDSPALNRIWVVRSLAVFDSVAPLTSQTKAGFLAVGNASAISVTDFTGANWTALPFADTFNNSSIRVNPNESVYVLVDSTTTGNITATLEIDDWADTAYEGQRF